MTRIMRDSTTSADVPVRGTELVAGYVNGKFAWTAAGFARFPGIPHINIDCLGTDPEKAEILDVEDGCSDVPNAVTWVKKRKAAFPDEYLPIIYCDRNTLTPLSNAMNAAGLRIAKDFRLWVATLDGTKTIQDMAGVTAVQYKRAPKKKVDGTLEAPSASITDGHYDESIVYDDDWHPEDDMPFTKQEIVDMVREGVHQELRAGVDAHGITTAQGAEAAVFAQRRLDQLAQEVAALKDLVTKALPHPPGTP